MYRIFLQVIAAYENSCLCVCLVRGQIQRVPKVPNSYVLNLPLSFAVYFLIDIKFICSWIQLYFCY